MAKTICAVFALLVTVFLKKSGASSDLFPQDPRDPEFTRILENVLRQKLRDPNFHVTTLLAVSSDLKTPVQFLNMHYVGPRNSILNPCKATFLYPKTENLYNPKIYCGLVGAPVIYDPRLPEFREELVAALVKHNKNDHVKQVLSVTTPGDDASFEKTIQYSTNIANQYCKVTFLDDYFKHECRMAPAQR